MSEDRTNRRFRESNEAPNAHEIFSPQQKLRARNQFLTEVTDEDGEFAVILCNLPPSVIVPLHSHADRETFYVMTGNVDLYRGDHWETLGPGETVDVQNSLRHAWRNSSETTASMLCVTTMRMARLLRDIAVDHGSADQSTAALHFRALVKKYGYWLATPEENAAIGLSVNWGQ